MIIRRILPSHLRGIPHFRSIRPISLRSSLTHSFSSSPSNSHEADQAATSSIPDQLLGSREELERVREEVKARYAERLKKKMEEEKVSSFQELKSKLAPVKPITTGDIASNPTDKPTAAASFSGEESTIQSSTSNANETTSSGAGKKPQVKEENKKKQSNADRSGIKPLSDILNLPLLFSTSPSLPLLWQSYHTLHPTLSSTFLSATIPPRDYREMVRVASGCRGFVVPLPREGGGYEMFWVWWGIHPTDGVSSWWNSASKEAPISKSGEEVHSPLPITSVLYTPLAEYRKNGEWAQPHLVMTHYPDLYNIPPTLSNSTSTTSEDSTSIPNGIHHPLILMRGEILSTPSSAPATSSLPTSHLALSQSEAQLLAMATQRFYCAGLDPSSVGRKESEAERKEREKRKEAVEMFARGDERFDWEGLAEMAYGGVV